MKTKHIFIPGVCAVLCMSLASCSVFSSSLDGYASGNQGTPDASANDASGHEASDQDAGEAGQPQTGLVLSPTAGDFGDVALDQDSSTISFTVRNNGPSATTTLLPTIKDGTTDFDLDTGLGGCTGQELAVGKECLIDVTFSPSKLGKQSTKLLLLDGDMQIAASADLTGNGVQQHTISITPPVTSFPDTIINHDSSPKDLLLTNVGKAATKVDVKLEGDHANAFSLDDSGCKGDLAPNTTCLLKLTAKPLARGVFSSTVTAVTSGKDAVSVQAVVKGLADANIVPSPSTVDFGIIPPGSKSTLIEVQLENQGDKTAQDVMVKLDQPPTGGFNQESTTCGTSLAPAEHCSTYFTFAPMTAGDYLAKFIVNWGAGATSVPLIGVSEKNDLVISPTHFEYSAVPLQSTTKGTPQTRTFVIKNTGSTKLSLFKVTLPTGASPFSFTGTTSPNACFQISSLDSGSSCLTGVRFDNFSGASAGAYTATLKASGSNVGGGGTVQATSLLKGTLLSPAKLTITPDHWDFGSVKFGNSSKSKIFKVTNIGQAATSGAITASLTGLGALQFQEVFNKCNQVLAPQQPCDVSYAFSPLKTGTFSANISVTGPNVSTQALLTGTASKDNPPPDRQK